MYVSSTDRKSILVTATKRATKVNDIIFSSNAEENAKKLMDES
jgi:hypothetical protein